jgi:hypothetical protein
MAAATTAQEAPMYTITDDTGRVIGHITPIQVEVPTDDAWTVSPTGPLATVAATRYEARLADGALVGPWDRIRQCIAPTSGRYTTLAAAHAALRRCDRDRRAHGDRIAHQWATALHGQ